MRAYHAILKDINEMVNEGIILRQTMNNVKARARYHRLKCERLETNIKALNLKIHKLEEQLS